MTNDIAKNGELLSIAPSTRRALVVLGPVNLAMLVIGGILLVRHGSAAELRVSWALIIVALGVTAFVLLWGRRTRMIIGAGQVGYVDFRGRKTLYALKDVHRVIERLVIMGGQRPSTMVYLLGPGNRVLFQLNRRIWTSGLDQFLKRIGRSVEKDAAPIKAKDLLRQLRGPDKRAP